MTKLEEKLIELGYKKREYSNVQYYKSVNGGIIHLDTTDLDLTYVEPKYIIHFQQHIIHFQQHINDLQLAFNEMQKDLEVLKNV